MSRWFSELGKVAVMEMHSFYIFIYKNHLAYDVTLNLIFNTSSNLSSKLVPRHIEAKPVASIVKTKK